MILRQLQKPVINGIVVLIATASPLVAPSQPVLRHMPTNSAKWSGKEVQVRRLDLVSRATKLSLGIAQPETRQRLLQPSRPMFVAQDALNGARQTL